MSSTTNAIPTGELPVVTDAPLRPSPRPRHAENFGQRLDALRAELEPAPRRDIVATVRLAAMTPPRTRRTLGQHAGQVPAAELIAALQRSASTAQPTATLGWIRRAWAWLLAAPSREGAAA